MKQADVVTHVTKTLEQYINQPITDDAQQEVVDKLDPFIKECGKKGTSVTIKMYRIETYALCAFIFVKYSGEERIRRPEVVWVETPRNFNTDEAYQRAMGMF